MSAPLFTKEKEIELTNEYLRESTLNQIAERENCNISTIQKLVKRHATQEQIAIAHSRNNSLAKSGKKRKRSTVEKTRKANTKPRIETICPVCNTTFQHLETEKRTFCSIDCYLKSFRGGKSTSPIKTFTTCLSCGKEFEVFPYIAKDERYGKYCSKECANYANSLKRGSETGNWKGGTTKQNHLIRGYASYKEWRQQVFERNDYTCQRCGKKGVYLEAHHIKSFSDYPKLRFDINNGITLCSPCHGIIDPRRHRTLHK